MRFHWGLGVGHAYAHDGGAPSTTSNSYECIGGLTSQLHPVQTEPVQEGAGSTAMDVDLASHIQAQAGSSQKSYSVADSSNDSAYDRPQGSDVLADDTLSDSDGIPDIQEPESSDYEDDVFR